jgi:CubicO group peptidase (beta-lactamase class C family)
LTLFISRSSPDALTGEVPCAIPQHWLGIIVARACDADLKSYGQEHLFSPIGAEVGDWIQDVGGYYQGGGEIRFTAREMAKFGLLYVNDGEYERTRSSLLIGSGTH